MPICAEEVVKPALGRPYRGPYQTTQRRTTQPMAGTPSYQRLFAELKRRRVFKIAAVYGGVAFVVLQVANILVPALART